MNGRKIQRDIERMRMKYSDREGNITNYSGFIESLQSYTLKAKQLTSGQEMILETYLFALRREQRVKEGNLAELTNSTQ